MFVDLMKPLAVMILFDLTFYHATPSKEKHKGLINWIFIKN